MNHSVLSVVARLSRPVSHSGTILLLGCLAVLVGCQPSTPSRLLGKWEGHPDTPKAAASREALQKAKQPAGEADSSLLKPTSNGHLGETLLEGFEVGISLHFTKDKKVAMQLLGKQEPLVGVWRVVTTLPPDGAEIEIGLMEKKSTKGKTPVKRRFLIEFHPNGETPGFTLQEKGADPAFGRLYFKQVK